MQPARPLPAMPSISAYKCPLPTCRLSAVKNLLKLLTEGRDDSQRYTQWLVNSQVVPSYEDTSIPAVQEYRDLMNRYAPQPPAELFKRPLYTL